MTKSKPKPNISRVSKQDTNKLLTAIDQVTIPIPDLFAEEHLTKDEKASLNRSHQTTCIRCNECFTFHKVEIDQLYPDMCPTCEENMFRVERGDQDAMDYYKEFYCNLCEQNHYYDPSAKLIINGSDAKPYKAPTIDDVIPDGFICLPCYQYCYDNLVLNKANVRSRKALLIPMLGSHRLEYSS